MAIAERLVVRLMRSNARRIASIDPASPNPRPLEGVRWHDSLVHRLPAITAEWEAFAAAGQQLPHIEDVLGEGQGNIGPWRVGILRSNGVATALARRSFPATLAAVTEIPGLRAALWSVLDAGTELTEHVGPNAGVLRYHLGIDCPTGSMLRVGDIQLPYTDAAGILFDDTVPHAAWNRGSAPRVTLFCELDRPLPRAGAWQNRAVQAVLALDGRRRRVISAADEWDASLNHSL